MKTIFPFYFLLIQINACDSDRKLDRYSKEKKEESVYIDTLKSAAETESIDVCFARAVYDIEYYDPLYISSTGAVGIMELMPREGSYTTVNYDNYIKARKRRNHVFEGKTVEEWAEAYVLDLTYLLEQYKNQSEKLVEKDKRFDPKYNIQEGVRELAVAYHYFRAKNYEELRVMEFAAASYNAGIPAVENGGDHVPKNDATEYYVPEVMRIYTKRSTEQTCLSFP